MKKILTISMVAGMAASANAGDCAGDCNGDNIANILDFVCFQQEWQAQTAAGDCDGNNVYNILDFVCFQQEWQDFANNGCDPGGDPLNDNFDDLNVGNACGQNGWDPWYLDNGVCAEITDENSFSPNNSMKLGVGDDMVQLFDITEGQWTYEVQTFVPEEAIGRCMVIMLNQYEHGNPNNTNNWSIQVVLDSDLGTVEAQFSDPIAVLKRGEWVLVRCEIDLAADNVDYYYDGGYFGSSIYTDGNFAGGPGLPQIQCIDLYNDTMSPACYFDDVKLLEGF
jgi:hypothetical protein